MTTYEIYINGKCVKKYHYRLQAVIYLAIKGYLFRGRGKYWLANNVEIKEKQNNESV